jgi:hypothetical protein
MQQQKPGIQKAGYHKKYIKIGLPFLEPGAQLIYTIKLQSSPIRAKKVKNVVASSMRRGIEQEASISRRGSRMYWVA